MLSRVTYRSFLPNKFQHISLKNLRICRYLIDLHQLKYYGIGKKKDSTTTSTAGTVTEVRASLMQIMGLKPGYRPVPESREHLNKYLPNTQEELPPRTMSDSFVSAIIPLTTDLRLQDKYTSYLGRVRMGRLLEDMDIFAVYVAHKHVSYPKLPKGTPTPCVFVTVLVDKIDFTDFRPMYSQDIRLSGHVSWVGKSSVEVVVWVEQQEDKEWQKITKASFLMAARNATAKKAAVVNALVPTDNEEKRIMEGGIKRREARRIVVTKQLTKVIPNKVEQNIIHDLFVKTIDINDVGLHKRILPEGSMWMRDCVLQNVIVSYPEDRNLHNNVFGGFMMRQALEVSWGLGTLYSQFKPRIISMSDISFHRPIPVNTLIRMKAHVVFAYKQYFEVTVYAEAHDQATGKHFTTNSFYLTYEVSKLVKELYPHSYNEVMMYIDGRRHFSRAVKSLAKIDFKDE